MIIIYLIAEHKLTHYPLMLTQSERSGSPYGFISL
jgi:hypothetical protein